LVFFFFSRWLWLLHSGVGARFGGDFTLDNGIGRGRAGTIASRR
jgi:hypothetical protein